MTDAKQATEDEKPKAAKYAQSSAFDELAAAVMVMYACLERTANLLDADLSKASRRPGEDSAVFASGIRTSDQLARMIAADESLSLDEKWLLQGTFRKWAKFMAQNGSLWSQHIYPNVELANKIIASGYVGARGYADPVFLRRASIAGNILRFLETHGTDSTEEHLQALSATLALHRSGMNTSVEMAVDKQGIAHVSGGVQRAT